MTESFVPEERPKKKSCVFKGSSLPAETSYCDAAESEKRDSRKIAQRVNGFVEEIPDLFARPKVASVSHAKEVDTNLFMPLSRPILPLVDDKKRERIIKIKNFIQHIDTNEIYGLKTSGLVELLHEELKSLPEFERGGDIKCVRGGCFKTTASIFGVCNLHACIFRGCENAIKSNSLCTTHVTEYYRLKDLKKRLQESK